MIKEEIKKIITDTMKSLSKKDKVFSSFGGPNIEESSRKEFGDWTAFIYQIKTIRQNSNKSKSISGQNFSEENCLIILEQIKKHKDFAIYFKKVEFKRPTFFNFFVADKVFIDNLKSVDENYGKTKRLRGKKIVIDYTDPNPFKEFHIGHLMNNAIGESISRILEFQGAKIKRVCFQGDVGIHVAKAIWGYQNAGILEKSSELGKWAHAYFSGSKVYEESEQLKTQIIEINKKIYNRSDKEINKLYDEGKKISLEHFDEIYKKLDTKFDDLIFESQVIDLGKQIVEKGLKDGVFEKGGGGAIIFRGENYACPPNGRGLHTRVFINSDGLPTYEAKDLGLAELKYKKYKYDESVVVTANEQNSHFAVMLCALDKVNKKLAEKTKHISHGMLKLPEGKMSSRTGNVITGESLIEKVKELVLQKIKNRDLLEGEKKEISKTVAIGAIKYSILKQSIGSDIIYDFDKSISFEGDSGPYLQYSYTRAKSVLRKAKEEGIKASFKKVPVEITQLEKMISYFPEIILQAEKSLEPHFITLYLTELAGIFNNYYAKNKIVDKLDEFSPYKIALTNAFAETMKNGMWLLGIKTLEKM